MPTSFNSDLDADVSIDGKKHVRTIEHRKKLPMPNETNARSAAISYVNQMSDLLEIPKNTLAKMDQNLSFREPEEREVEYHFSEEKHLFDSTTVSFRQTFLNVPVWRSGLTVTVTDDQHSVVNMACRREDNINAKFPSKEIIDKYQKLFVVAEKNIEKIRKHDGKHEDDETTPFIQNLIDTSKLSQITTETEQEIKNNARLIRGRFYVYRYDEKERVPPAENLDLTSDSDFEHEYIPILPLFPVHEKIKNDEFYLAAEITFCFDTSQHGHINWIALVELETNSVLYLRPLSASITGKVFKYDPITSSGDAGNLPSSNNATLNPLATSETLQNLNSSSPQSLIGTHVEIRHIEYAAIDPPTNSSGVDFDYDARTNNFAAVNAYYHTDRFFAMMEDLGFSRSSYFSKTTFPLHVDHRGYNGNRINAHCPGNGNGGIGHCCYALADTADIANPMGIACDWRIHLHELGGHGVLYEFVDGPNFRFAHSAGDSIAMIMNDPETQVQGNDRFVLAPFVPAVSRRSDRSVTDGWGWGGSIALNPFSFTFDRGGYNNEQILSTTLFRAYRSIGGDSSDTSRKWFAARTMTYLILRAISTLTPATNPSNASGFASALMAVDLLDWTTEGIHGGAYRKVLRWAFEKQGMFQSTGTITPNNNPGDPPDVDVYIDDGRGGEYPYQPEPSDNISIWNATAPGGITHEAPVVGVTNYAYVKIKNRGTQIANNVKVCGYHSNSSAGVVWPNDFQPMTTSEEIVGTLAGNNGEEKIVGPFEWTPAINSNGYDSMLMIVSSDVDLSNADNFTSSKNIENWRLVPNDNNIGQKNVHPGGSPPPPILLPPSGFESKNPTTSSIDLKWDRLTGIHDGFVIRRRRRNIGSFDEITRLSDADTTSYPDTGLSSNTWYEYKITSFDGNGESTAATDSAKTGGCFVVTATYGTKLESKAQFVHEFYFDVVRESKLKKPFDKFLQIYFKVSPPIANLMYRSKPFKYFMKYTVVIPFLAFSRVAVFLVDLNRN